MNAISTAMPETREYRRHKTAANTWALVLAAGEGSRLQSLTTTVSGLAIPKQFCTLDRGPSLLEQALWRGAEVALYKRLCAIVAAQHRRWWKKSLVSLPRANVFVQPENRGTANGILLPLLHIIEHDPEANVVLLPADHYVEDEPTLAESLHQAVEHLAFHSNEVLVLGIEPEGPDPELGYIVPGEADGRRSLAVDRFVEKPTRTQALALIGQGGLWNAFILAAKARALLGLFDKRVPEIVTAMRKAVQCDLQAVVQKTATCNLYSRLPHLDFSRHIMQGQETQLRVLPVQSCGWCDLGTPQRVVETLSRLSTPMPQSTHALRHQRPALLSLADQFRLPQHRLLT